MHALIVGVGMGIAIAAPVGPVGAICIERSLSHGAPRGLASALGAGIADAIYGALAALGVSALMETILRYEIALRIFGALFLFALAIRTLMAKPIVIALTSPTGALVSDTVSTFILTLTSPVTVITFAALLASAGSVSGSATWIVLGVFCGSAFWYGSLSLVASLLRGKLVTNMLRVQKVSAGFLFACGVFSAAVAIRALVR